jgi:hypothetical protein
MEKRPLTLPVGPDRRISLELAVPRTASMEAILILGHGANNTMDHPVIAGLAHRLGREGVVTVRFNFPYSEAGRQHPDPDPVLEGVFRLVAEYVSESEEFKGLGLFLGGKSMGGRIAAQLVAQGLGANGVVFLGYPLHPPGRPEQLRDRPLYQLPCPALFVEGGSDPFCHFDRLGPVLARMPVRTDLHVLPGLGHSFESGKTIAAETLDEVARVIVGWLDSL